MLAVSGGPCNISVVVYVKVSGNLAISLYTNVNIMIRINALQFLPIMHLLMIKEQDIVYILSALVYNKKT